MGRAPAGSPSRASSSLENTLCSALLGVLHAALSRPKPSAQQRRTSWAALLSQACNAGHVCAHAQRGHGLWGRSDMRGRDTAINRVHAKRHTHSDCRAHRAIVAEAFSWLCRTQCHGDDADER